MREKHNEALKQEQDFFDALCREYYARVLGYLYAVLGDEAAARDCTQEVFLTALQKITLLHQHPSPGGFLFQTAKTLAKKARRQSFARLLREEAIAEHEQFLTDTGAAIEAALDKEIDERQYIDAVLDALSEEKRRLYTLHYISGKSMGEIAQLYGVAEPALRMRYVRLRREIKAIAGEIARKNFIS